MHTDAHGRFKAEMPWDADARQTDNRTDMAGGGHGAPRAEAAGRVGDFIPLRNMESGKTFRARVVRKGFVAVE